jgi:hypothetical protein
MSAAIVASARDAPSGRSSTTTTTTTTKSDSQPAFCNGKQTRQQNEPGNAERTFTEGGNPNEKLTDHQSQLNGSSSSAPLHAPASSATKSKSQSETPFPADMRKILLEVAQSAICSHLPWNAPQSHAKPQIPLGTSVPPSAAHSHIKRTHHHHSIHLRPTPHYGSTGGISAPPPRKKHRNGLHSRPTRRFADAAPSGVRKRPLVLIRTTTSAASATVFSPPGSSVGSGRTSGSEPEDTPSQYECDSEGTSATSNSELSRDRSYGARRHRGSKLPPASTAEMTAKYSCLRELFRVAISLLLEHYYQHRGGYKLSPVEKRRHVMTMSATATSSAMKNDEKQPMEISAQNGINSNTDLARGEAEKKPSPEEEVFRQRWQRVLSLLEQPTGSLSEDVGPPFTIQRIAEVLIAPERYYTQTHKLCNCLEKLLLVTSPTSAFGGDTSQSRREEREIAALDDEKGRLQSQLRQRRLRRRASSMSDEIAESNDVTSAHGRHAGGLGDSKGEASPPERKLPTGSGGEASGGSARMDPSSTSREMLEAAARASLRTKFDHVGIDPHHVAAGNNRDVRAIADHRGMTSSPPPPSFSMAAGAPGIALTGHSSLLRQHHDQDHHGLARAPSPILFNSGGEASSSPPMGPNIHLLHVNHAVAVPGLSPFELMAFHSASSSSHENAATATSAMTATISGMAKDLDLESRSSASSDVDSESDDVSFDDSASDRSDGSDSGGPYEPFSAARAMALNRMQQQQRLQQTRMLTSMHHSGPPADTEYQSGDSIDSTRAEDSEGSDSSMSDMAD